MRTTEVLKAVGREHGPGGPWAHPMKCVGALGCGCPSPRVAMTGHYDGCEWQTALADARKRDQKRGA